MYSQLKKKAALKFKCEESCAQAASGIKKTGRSVHRNFGKNPKSY